MTPRDLIEQAARCQEFDELAEQVPESGFWVRDFEALASIAISLKRIADLAEADA